MKWYSYGLILGWFLTMVGLLIWNRELTKDRKRRDLERQRLEQDYERSQNADSKR